MTFAATEVVLRPAPFDSPDAVTLIAALQGEYLTRYGGHDDTPVDPAEFAPPHGRFFIARIDGTPVGCGGWRDHTEPGGPRVAELKRMYVAESVRRRGVARLILAEAERTAAEAGYTRLILESGDRQPEAVALYASAGYRAATPFGLYADSDGAVHLAKDL